MHLTPSIYKLAWTQSWQHYFTFMIVYCVPAVALCQAHRPLQPIAAKLEPTVTVVYKKTAIVDLKLHVFQPVGHVDADCRAAFVIFHGGGWTGGNARRCYPFVDYFRQQGMVGISVDYRLLRSGASTVFDCVEDGKSAIRYLRSHAEELGIDPQKIVVAGCSAGGHVAAGTALFNDSEPPSTDNSDGLISATPNALVLYYAVVDTSADGYGQAKIGERWKTLSPVHNVGPGLPPTLLFHGTTDTVTPFSGAKVFHQRMLAEGNECQLVSHPDGRHGYLIFDLKLFRQSLNTTHQFLAKQGFLPAEVSKIPQ